MTVSYTQEVATERIGGFFRLLFRWRGSIYSVLYGEMVIFLILYGTLSIIYRHVLTEIQRASFEKLCDYFESFADYIPVTFVIGFYVSRIIARRWTQWENIPLPDRFAFNISSYLHGVDLKSRMLRRTLVRYANLATILCFCDICMPVKKRFPTLEHLIVGGLMTKQEKDLYEDTKDLKDSNWWIPFHWAYTLLYRAKQEGKLPEGFSRLQDDILDLRNKCWVLFSHDWIPIPMIFTQVATLAVYLFGFACILGRQYLDPTKGIKGHEIDLYVPFFTIFQLTFYLGWLKVAEVLISPMGMDADDFEINYIVERNLKMSYAIVDYNYNKLPPLEQDVHWDVEPEMPHTVASAGVKDTPFIGSAANVPVKDKDTRLMEFPVGETIDSLKEPQTPLSRQASTRASTARPPSAVWRSLTRLVSKAPNEMMAPPVNDIQLGSPKLKRQTTIHEDDTWSMSPLIERQKSSQSRSKEPHLARLANITEQSDELLLDLASPEDIYPASGTPSPRGKSQSIEGDKDEQALFKKPEDPKSPPSVAILKSDRSNYKTSVAEEQTTRELPLS